MPDANWSNLIAAARAGDPRAWQSIVEHLRPQLRKAAAQQLSHRLLRRTDPLRLFCAPPLYASICNRQMDRFPFLRCLRYLLFAPKRKQKRSNSPNCFQRHRCKPIQEQGFQPMAQAARDELPRVFRDLNYFRKPRTDAR